MASQEVQRIQTEIFKLKEELQKARREQSPEPVADHALTLPSGEQVRISELFGDKDDLLLIHNMGSGCRYCTMWADGLNGALPHIENRTAFALVSADGYESIQSFADGRGWKFRILSGKGSDFTAAMGYVGEGGVQPGVSAFRRLPDGSIVRTGHDSFGPGDDYCAPWPLFDLLDGGAGDWAPKYAY